MPDNRSTPEPRGGEASEGGASVHVAVDNGSNTTHSSDPQAARVAALDHLRFDYIAEAFGYVQSFAVSAREAAWRGNRELLEVHARQTCDALKSALEVRRELGSLEAGR
jgi:hypothetical protein